MSFEDAYQLALKRSESVGIQDELLDQAHEQIRQAKGAMLPSVNLSETALKQADGASTAVLNSQGQWVSSPQSFQNTLKLNATQPIFKGFRDFAALRQRKIQFESQESALQNAAKQLFYDTALAYYNVLQFSSDVAHYETEIEVSQKRLQELEGFVRIGRSQITDVLTQKSNIASLEATLEVTRGQLQNAKDLLAFFTGMDSESPLADRETPPATPGPLSQYLEQVEKRPDVANARGNVAASEEGVPLAWGQNLPSIDLLGNYYFDRPGAQANVNWDFQIALTLPIFQGGIIQSQTRQAASVERQSELQLSQVRRSAETEIRQLYNSFSADQKQIAKIAETADLSKRNYEAQIKEYRNGLVTNLDVLQATTTWQDSLRLLSRQQYVARLDFLKLQAASGYRKEIYIASSRVH